MKHIFNFLLYPNMQPMDLLGPWEVISTWKMLYPQDVTAQIVSEQVGEVKCVNDITLTSHCDFANAPLANYLIVPGGKGRLEEMHNPNLIQFIQQQARHCKYVIAVCTGTFLLAEAGLLNDRTATTYWRALPELEQYKQIKICERRVVQDGNLWFSGGISSGIDLAFALIDSLAGSDVAGQVQLAFEYFPDPKIYARRRDVAKIPPYMTLTNETPIRVAKYMDEKLKE